METLEARLKSFEIVHAPTKKRTSSSKGAAKLQWPHNTPAPAQLARAGFFYNPKPSTPDNTTCYLCNSSLDGWEEDDSPVGEHLNFSPHCGWAIIARVEQTIEDGKDPLEDATDESLVNARGMTFGTRWPHENKRGWLCRTQKMVEAGWYYCPTADSDDFVRCCYCNLGLDGWEPKDNPYNEHQRRSPDCMFFTLSEPQNKKTARSKRGRASKASRVSTQSNITAVSEDFSMVDVTRDERPLPLQRELEPVESGHPTKSTRKGTKGKKIAPTSKRKASATQQEETVQGSSFVEPEDDDFEVKVERQPPQKLRGRKRKSDEMSVDEGSTQIEPQVIEQPSDLQPAKRRATRYSVSHGNKVDNVLSATGLGRNSQTVDTTDVSSQPAPIPKQGRKAGRPRASTTARNASTTSTASKASLRAAIPDDNEIDAALEAELNRLTTDDEAEPDGPTISKAKTRRLTRTRPGSRSATASTAPVQRATRASALPDDRESIHGVDAPSYDVAAESLEEPKAVEIALTAIDHAKQEIVSETNKQLASKAKSRGRASFKSAKATKKSTRTVDEGHDLGESQAVELKTLATKESSRGSISHHSSDQLPKKFIRTSEVSMGGNIGDDASELNSSVLAPSMPRDENLDETHGGRASQIRGKKGGKPRGAAAKRGKAVKKSAAAGRKIEGTAYVEPEDFPKTHPIVMIDNNVPHYRESTAELTLPGTPQADDQAANTSIKKPAETNGEIEMSASKASSIEPAEPVEKSPVTAYKDKTATGIATPADSQGQDEVRRTPLRSPSPRAQAPSIHETPKMVASPQSSDAENQPPSSRPSALRPPLIAHTPSKTQTARIPLAAITPIASPSKRSTSRLQSTFTWEPIDFEKIFNPSPAAKENIFGGAVNSIQKGLSSPEKKLTVEEWIQWNAKQGEERLREDCERLVGQFEGEGVRALKTLEGIICIE